MTDNIIVACVPPEMLGQMWPHVGPLLMKGQQAGDATVGEAIIALNEGIAAVGDGSMQLWVVFDDLKLSAAMVSEIVDDDGEKTVWVTGMGGENITRWGSALSERMADFAKAEGCSCVRFKGRKALQRTYSDVSCLGLDEGNGVYIYERAVR